MYELVNECGALVEWYWQGRTEVGILRKKPRYNVAWSTTDPSSTGPRSNPDLSWRPVSPKHRVFFPVIKEGKADRTLWHAAQRVEVHSKFCLEIPKERDLRKILNLILKERDGMVWTGLIWIGMVTSTIVSLWLPYNSTNYWLAQYLLAIERGLCSMESD